MKHLLLNRTTVIAIPAAASHYLNFCYFFSLFLLHDLLVHSFIKHLLSIDYEVGIMPGTGDPKLNKIGTAHALINIKMLI